MRLLLGLLATLSALAPVHAREEPWTAEHAYVLPEGRWELGIFAPLAVGVANRVELSTHPLLDALMPTFSAKVGWVDAGALSFASEHTLGYPTPLIKTLSTPGIGGLWPGDTVVPHLLAFHSHAIASYDFGGHVVTGRAGVMLAAQLTPSTLQTADPLFLYQRTAHWVDGVSLRFGLVFRGDLAGDFDYELDVNVYVMPAGEYADGSPVLEQSGRMVWRVSPCVRLDLGWAISGGDLPGPDDWAIVPTFDARFAWW